MILQTNYQKNLNLIRKIFTCDISKLANSERFMGSTMKALRLNIKYKKWKFKNYNFN